MMRSPLIALLLLLSTAGGASAEIALLLGEPYGTYGRFNPTGHAAVYLSGICAESPTVLRRCSTGETGVVISRYYRVAGLDWIAMPLLSYLYAVDRADLVPPTADQEIVASLRHQYRTRHLGALIPDTAAGTPPDGTWIELMGAAYDRRLVAFLLPTTEAQDDEFIRILHARPNKSRFNLLSRNCADFARDLIHIYYPKALKTNIIADLGVTTPKQLARSMMKYADRQPEVHLRAFTIPQVPGSRKDSRSIRGVLESFVTSKKYLVPLALVQPWIPVGMAAGYLATGRFDAQRHVAAAYGPDALEAGAHLATAAGVEGVESPASPAEVLALLAAR